MKIIGQTKTGYLLETPGDEIANILGSPNFASLPRQPKLGNDLNVAGIFAKAQALEATKAKLLTVKADLEALAAAVAPVVGVIDS